MSAPSTTSYVPFDSDAPQVFSVTQTDNYLIIGFIGLLLYDHLITLDMELEWIWTLRWRLPKIIFVVNRYVITSLLVLSSIPDLIFPISVSFCNFHLYLWLGLPLLNFGAAELLIIIRVCSLYGHQKIVVWLLGLLLAAALIGAMVAQGLFGHALQPVLYYEFLPGCWQWSPGVPNQWAVWVTFLTIEGVLMLLTAYKTLAYRKQSNRTIVVLARDSIVYFVVIFACLATVLADDVGANLKVSIEIPAQCITSIAVGRMMMNIRGLILDDPDHTIHLQPMQFVAPNHSASGIEEVA